MIEVFILNKGVSVKYKFFTQRTKFVLQLISAEKRDIMKDVEKKKSVPVIPQGVWEGSHTDKEEKESNHYKNMVTDLQGNGYAKPEKNEQK